MEEAVLRLVDVQQLLIVLLELAPVLVQFVAQRKFPHPQPVVELVRPVQIKADADALLERLGVIV